MKYLVLVVQLKKTDYNTQITDIEKKLTDHNHGKYITTPEFNNLVASVFNARSAQGNLITKTDFDTKLSSLNRKVTSNKSKHLLVENELKKLKTFDSSNFRCKNYFKEDDAQNYLVIQPIYQCFKGVVDVGTSNILIFENLKACLIKILYLLLQVIINPQISYHGTKTRVEFDGSF